MFVLDKRLASDTIKVAEFELCDIRLMNDQQYPWVILVPKIANITEVIELTSQQQEQLWLESKKVCLALQRLFKPDKLNIASIGNIVSQLHLHHVCRFKTDIAWPKPVWGYTSPQAYSPSDVHIIMEDLKSELFAH